MKKKKEKEEKFLPPDAAEILEKLKKIRKKIDVAHKATAKSKLSFPKKVGER